MTFCCRELRAQEGQSCDVHASPWACPDVVVVRRRDGTYGLPVRDGEAGTATSSISISHCPWCGSPLPGHPTRPPTAADRAAGAWSGRAVVGREGDERAALERPIVRAAEAGDLASVRALLAAGVSVFDPEHDGWTALHAAAVRRHPEVVRELLQSGAEVDVLSDGFTPLLNAAGPGDASSVTLLIEAGANVDYAHPLFEWTPLSRAADYANADVLEVLLRAGADPNSGDPVVAAAEVGCLRCVELLAAAGADLAVRVEGETLAQRARRHGHEDVARRVEQPAH